MTRSNEEQVRRIVAARAARGRRRCVRETGVGVVEMALVEKDGIPSWEPISNNDYIRQQVIYPVLKRLPFEDILALARKLA